MIKNLKIKNFQIIKELDLVMSKFTVLVGKTGSGKSSIIRAIGAMRDGIRGVGPIRYGEKEFDLQVTTETGDLQYIKSKDGALNRVSINGKIYDKIGVSFPNEAKGLLNLLVLPLGDQDVDVSLQSQHDSPFLIGMKGSKSISEVFSKVTGLDKLAEMVELAVKLKKDADSGVKDNDNLVKEAADSLVELAKSNELNDEIVEVISLSSRLELYIEKIKQLKIMLTILKYFKILRVVQFLLGMGEQLVLKQSAIGKLKEHLILLRQRGKIQSRLDFAEVALKDIRILSSEAVILSQRESRINSMKSLVNNFNQLKAVEKAIVEVEKTLKVCPVCLRPF